VNHGEIVSFLWGVADLIRDTFKRGKYQDVILPLTVLRRLDCVLAPTKPHVPDAWIDTTRRDEKDGQVGLVGYEINFNRYFYRYTPPRPLEAIEADIRAIEQDILKLLREVAG
jgi:type I restriction-modification system DNA methylase subunit